MIMIHLKKHILTLVALLAVTTQAWAGVIFTSLKVGDVIHVGDQLSFSENWGHDNFLIPSPAPPFTLMRANLEEFDPFAAETHVTPDEDGAYYVFQIYSNGEFSYDLIYDARFPVTANSDGLVVTNIVTSGMHKDYTFAVHEAYPVPVAWNADTKTGTIAAMPAGNVIVNVEYYQDAAFAMSTGTTPMALAPTANNSARANTDDPLVTGGEVANIVEGTEALEAKQGTLMYYFDKTKATTQMTAAQLEALTADKWSDKVPTADGLHFDAATDVFVYYYIKGADDVAGLADGVKHTFSDSDPVCLTVSVQKEPTFKVELNAEGLTTAEAANWKAAKGTDDPAAFPLTGVKKDDNVTVTYSGSRKVIGLKAEKIITIVGDGATVPATTTTTLNITGCTTWAQIIEKNSNIIETEGNFIFIKDEIIRLAYKFNYGLVSKDADFDPNVEYLWVNIEN